MIVSRVTATHMSRPMPAHGGGSEVTTNETMRIGSRYSAIT